MMNETIFLGGRPIAAWGVGAANPASENCVAKGGKVEITDTPAGQSGICVFPDGTRCEEWALLRGQCAPGAPPRRHISPLLTFPAGGAVIGGLIGYAVKRDAHGTAVGAAVGAAAPFALAAVVIASGWSP